MKIKRKDNARKKDAILEAGLDIFAQKGFQDATISEIAKQANVAEATIYEYFENKETLLFSILAKKQNEALDLLEFQLAGIKGALNKIRKLVWFYFWFFQHNRPWSSVVLMILRPNIYPAACHGEPMAEFIEGRHISLVEGGVNDPPENSSEQGGQRAPCREFTFNRCPTHQRS
jgi:TetR/AcrR family fatty acid metabolism transcriptional regulator